MDNTSLNKISIDKIAVSSEISNNSKRYKQQAELPQEEDKQSFDQLHKNELQTDKTKSAQSGKALPYTHNNRTDQNNSNESNGIDNKEIETGLVSQESMTSKLTEDNSKQLNSDNLKLLNDNQKEQTHLNQNDIKQDDLNNKPFNEKSTDIPRINSKDIELISTDNNKLNAEPKVIQNTAQHGVAQDSAINAKVNEVAGFSKQSYEKNNSEYTKIELKSNLDYAHKDSQPIKAIQLTADTKSQPGERINEPELNINANQSKLINNTKSGETGQKPELSLQSMGNQNPEETKNIVQRLNPQILKHSSLPLSEIAKLQNVTNAQESNLQTNIHNKTDDVKMNIDLELNNELQTKTLEKGDSKFINTDSLNNKTQLKDFILLNNKEQIKQDPLQTVQNLNTVRAPNLNTNLEPIALNQITEYNTIQNQNTITQIKVREGMLANSPVTHLDSTNSQAISDKIYMMLTRHEQSARIVLDPPELGLMEINILNREGATNIIFNTQHATTKDVIQSQLDALKNSLEDQGIDLGDLNVFHQERGNEQTDDHPSGSYQLDAHFSDPQSEDMQSLQASKLTNSIIDLYA